MDLLRKKLTWLIIALLIFIGLVKWIGPYYMQYLSKSTYHTQPVSGQDGTSSDNQLPTQKPGTPNPSTVVKPADEYGGRVVNYSDHKFTPNKINLKQEDPGYGCFLKIINNSSAPLTIRLGPYEKSVQNNYGYAYEAISPGQSLTIDPRFGMRTEEYLNLQLPDEKFQVDFDKTCIPE